jgi:hypothetical protein
MAVLQLHPTQLFLGGSGRPGFGVSSRASLAPGWVLEHGSSVTDLVGLHSKREGQLGRTQQATRVRMAMQQILTTATAGGIGRQQPSDAAAGAAGVALNPLAWIRTWRMLLQLQIPGPARTMTAALS